MLLAKSVKTGFLMRLILPHRKSLSSLGIWRFFENPGPEHLSRGPPRLTTTDFCGLVSPAKSFPRFTSRTFSMILRFPHIQTELRSAFRCASRLIPLSLVLAGNPSFAATLDEKKTRFRRPQSPQRMLNRPTPGFRCSTANSTNAGSRFSPIHGSALGCLENRARNTRSRAAPRLCRKTQRVPHDSGAVFGLRNVARMENPVRRKWQQRGSDLHAGRTANLANSDSGAVSPAQGWQHLPQR